MKMMRDAFCEIILLRLTDEICSHYKIDKDRFAKSNMDIKVKCVVGMLTEIERKEYVSSVFSSIEALHYLNVLEYFSYK